MYGYVMCTNWGRNDGDLRPCQSMASNAEGIARMRLPNAWVCHVLKCTIFPA